MLKIKINKDLISKTFNITYTNSASFVNNAKFVNLYFILFDFGTFKMKVYKEFIY